KEDHEDTKLKVLTAGAYAYLSKPINFGELLHGIATINSIRRTEYLGKSFKILAEIAYSLQQTFDFDALVKKIVEGAGALGWHRARLYLFDEARETLVGKAGLGMPARFVGYKIPLGESPIINAILEKPIVLDVAEIKSKFGEEWVERWLTDLDLTGITWL